MPVPKPKPLQRSDGHGPPQTGAMANLEPASSTADATSQDKVNILLVDDLPGNLLALEAILAGLGENLVKAQSGVDCLRCLLDRDFAVILLDVKMPQIDGFETAALIRQRQRCQHTPIIFLSASETSEVQVFKGYSLGAVDYLCKPLVSHVLRAKVAVFVDMFRKSQQVTRQAELLRKIEEQQHERRLTELRERWESERLREEIGLARQIQQRLLPAAPLHMTGFDVGGDSLPADATGGDYFDYLPMPDGSLGIVIADVNGHGCGPALLMAQMRAYLRAFVKAHTEPAEIVDLLNRALSGDTPEDHFATLLLARLNPRDRSLHYVSAGHPTGYVLNPAGTVKALLPSTCMPLAVTPDVPVAAAPAMILDPGDGVVLLTNGIADARSADGTPFGSRRALDVVHAHWHGSAREIVDNLFAAVASFCEGQVALDDRTAVVIKAAGAPGV